MEIPFERLLAGLTLLNFAGAGIDLSAPSSLKPTHGRWDPKNGLASIHPFLEFRRNPANVPHPLLIPIWTFLIPIEKAWYQPMNRIESLARTSLASFHEAGTPRKISEHLTTPLSLSFPHRFFSPEHYEPRYDYPLVIWLHSDASSEREIENVMPSLSLRNYVAVGIRGTHASQQRKNRYDWNLHANGLAVAEECVFEAIDSIRESVSIHPRRVFVAGFGRGGTLAQWIGLRNPDRFAGVFSINGPFPNLPKSLVRWKQAKNLPILWMHGNESERCGIDAMSDMLKAVYPAALQVFPVQFPCGDELDSHMLAKANRFMMQIVTNERICMHESTVS